MGLGMEFLKWFSRTGRLPAKGRLLDIGESCLLAANKSDIEYVLDRHGCPLPRDVRSRIAEEYAFRSTQCGLPTIPTLFLGDLMKLTAVEYVSLDVVSARHAERFDLNVHSLAAEHRGTFDTVFNFGTTEHLMNQFNAFKVMHEACKVGGWMFHQVPSTGYINHGYFSYNALMFQELAAANEYDLADLWFCGPEPGAVTVLVNSDQFPGVLDSTKLRNDVTGLRESPVPSSLINVLMRKTRDAEFRVGLEVKTAAGALTENARYTSRFIERAGGSPRVAV